MTVRTLFREKMIKIREFKETDTEQLEKLFLVARQQTFTWESSDNFKLEDFKKSIQGEVVFVAEEKNEILGFISVWAVESFIHNLFIRPDRQNEGIGKLLLKKAIEQFCLPLHLKALTQNTKACRFYESQGWEKIATYEDVPEPYHVYKYS